MVRDPLRRGADTQPPQRSSRQSEIVDVGPPTRTPTSPSRYGERHLASHGRSDITSHLDGRANGLGGTSSHPDRRFRARPAGRRVSPNARTYRHGASPRGAGPGHFDRSVADHRGGPVKARRSDPGAVLVATGSRGLDGAGRALAGMIEEEPASPVLGCRLLVWREQVRQGHLPRTPALRRPIRERLSDLRPGILGGRLRRLESEHVFVRVLHEADVCNRDGEQITHDAHRRQRTLALP